MKNSKWYLKFDSHLPKKLICFNKNPLKMIDNTFYYILKTLFILKAFDYSS